MNTETPAETPAVTDAARVARRFGMAPCDDAAVVAGRARFVDFGTDRDGLAAALADGRTHVIERTDDGRADGDWPAVPPVDRGFFLSLTTASAFGLQCSVLVCNVLAQRGVLTAEHRSVVELCLHEAVANAIVHGNLGIPSSAKDFPQGYRVFSQLVNERLREPALRRRRVDVMVRWDETGIEVAVGDQGNGFDVSGLPEQTGGKARSGRGFVFMRALATAVTVRDGGRCTVLRFDFPLA